MVKRLPWRCPGLSLLQDRKSTRLNSSHSQISYAVFCLKKKKKTLLDTTARYLRHNTPLQTAPFTRRSCTHMCVYTHSHTRSDPLTDVRSSRSNLTVVA